MKSWAGSADHISELPSFSCDLDGGKVCDSEANMCEDWIKARDHYCWEVNLARFQGARNYPGYFNRVVASTDVQAFEDDLRAAIDRTGSFQVVGEVCFWKNYGAYQARNRTTQELLTHLENPIHWGQFTQAVKQVAANPSFDNFARLREACRQPRGFAVPITFLAFYEPCRYPMVDKHIAQWWTQNKEQYGYEAYPEFSQRQDGWIRADFTAQSKHNWKSYIAWVEFCREYASKLAEFCRLNWRARDIEIAIWEAQKSGMPLVAML
jgi:hypothetical protein